LSAVRDCLFNIFAATLHIWRPFLHPQPEDAPCHGDRDPLIRTQNAYEIIIIIIIIMRWIRIKQAVLKPTLSVFVTGLSDFYADAVLMPFLSFGK
jgi:hypothetical protein